MESVVIGALARTSLDDLADALRGDFEVSRIDDGRVSATARDGHVFLNADTLETLGLGPSFDPKLSRFRSIFSIDFSDIRLARRAIEALLSVPGLWIDNDHGTSCRLADYGLLMNAHPDWDWRSDPV